MLCLIGRLVERLRWMAFDGRGFGYLGRCWQCSAFDRINPKTDRCINCHERSTAR